MRSKVVIESAVQTTDFQTVLPAISTFTRPLYSRESAPIIFIFSILFSSLPLNTASSRVLLNIARLASSDNNFQSLSISSHTLYLQCAFQLISLSLSLLCSAIRMVWMMSSECLWSFSHGFQFADFHSWHTQRSTIVTNRNSSGEQMSPLFHRETFNWFCFLDLFPNLSLSLSLSPADSLLCQSNKTIMWMFHLSMLHTFYLSCHLNNELKM